MSCSRVAVVTMALIVATLTLVVFGEPVMLLVRARVSASIHCTGIVETGASSLQYVYEDRIFDGNGGEVIWRGAGGSYLFHTADYVLAWEKHLPEIQEMGLNTVRLAFRFPDSSPREDGFTDSDTLDYAKLDDVLNWLARHNLKAILDCHNYGDMLGDFGSQKLINDWVEVAVRCRGDSRIVAYELFNEPGWTTYDKTWMTSRADAVKAYARLTDAIRQVDPEQIVIWASSNYLPAEFPEGFEEYVRQNVVYSVHRWYYRDSASDKLMFELWTPEQISHMAVGYLVEMREKLSAPFWLGEFGSHYPMNESNPEYLLTEQILFRCEEQVLGWNLWMGGVSIDKPWNAYLTFFPLTAYNEKLARKAWFMPIPKLTDYAIDAEGVDMFEPYRIELWHHNDYVTLKAGIVIIVITTYRNPDGIFNVLSEEKIQVTDTLKIRNEEYSGDRNTRIYSAAYLS